MKLKKFSNFGIVTENKLFKIQSYVGITRQKQKSVPLSTRDKKLIRKLINDSKIKKIKFKVEQGYVYLKFSRRDKYDNKFIDSILLIFKNYDDYYFIDFYNGHNYSYYECDGLEGLEYVIKNRIFDEAY